MSDPEDRSESEYQKRVRETVERQRDALLTSVPVESLVDSLRANDPEDRGAENLPQAIVNEQARVRLVIQRYEEAQKLVGTRGNCRPAIVMMTASINNAAQAIASDDVEAMVRALADLREYDQ